MKAMKFLAAALASLFLACGPAAAQTAKPIEFNYGIPTADHVTVFVAQDLGLFEKAGLKPRFYNFTSGAPLLAGLKSGSLDVVTAGLGLAFAIGYKTPLSILYVNSNDATGEGLVVNKNSPIQSFLDIGKAKKIGAVSGTCAQVALYLMAQKVGLDYAKLDIVNLPAPLLRNSFLSNSIDAGIAWSPYTAMLDAEGFKVVSWDPEYTPGGVCPGMTGARPEFLQRHPDVGVKLVELEAMAADAVAKNPQLAIDVLVKRLSLTPAAAKAAVERVYQQRPTLTGQLDAKSSHSLVTTDGGLVGKLHLAMQVLQATKTIPEPVPIEAIRQAVDPQYLKKFAATRRTI